MIWFKTCNLSLKSTLCQLICTPLCIYGLLLRHLAEATSNGNRDGSFLSFYFETLTLV